MLTVRVASTLQDRRTAIHLWSVFVVTSQSSLLMLFAETSQHAPCFGQFRFRRIIEVFTQRLGNEVSEVLVACSLKFS